MRRFLGVTAQIMLLIVVSCAEARAGETLELFTGSAYNFRTPLTIRQSGYEDIKLSARYKEEPFEGSPYYAWRIGKWKGNSGWELELVHHKIYLKNRPPEIQQFEISHGYNLLTINRAWKQDKLIFHVGVGVAITHSETTVRNRDAHTHFRISGPTAQAAVGKRFYLSAKLFGVIEGKLTVSSVRIPIRDGKATVPNVALHGLLGVGYDF